MTDDVEEYQEPDYTQALGKVPTSLQSRFADFLVSDEVGYAPATAKTKEEAFREGVRLAVALRIPFQASATNREATEQERLERQAAKEQAKADREAAKAARAAEAPAEEVEEAPAPKAPKAAKKAPAKKAAPAATPAAAPAATRPAPRRAPARKVTAASGAADAPF